MREAQHRLNLSEYFRRCECRNNVIKPTLPSADGWGDVKDSTVKQAMQVVWDGLISGPEASQGRWEERVGNSHLGAGDGQEQQRGGNSHHAAFQRGFTGMTLNFSKGSPRSNLGSLSSVGHCPHRSPKHLRTLSSPHPSLLPSPALPTASAALPAVSHLLQHLWVAAAGAGAGSSRAR